jgi:hypothetical protein
MSFEKESYSVEEILKENNHSTLVEFCKKFDIPSEFRGKIWLKLLKIELEDEFEEDVQQHFIKMNGESIYLEKTFKVIDKLENISKVEKYSLLRQIMKNFYKLKHFEFLFLY